MGSIESVEPVDLFLQHAVFLGKPDRVQDQLAQHVHQDMVVVVLQVMTGFQLSHEPDELGTYSRVGLVVFDNSSDRDGRRLDFTL